MYLEFNLFQFIEITIKIYLLTSFYHQIICCKGGGWEVGVMGCILFMVERCMFPLSHIFHIFCHLYLHTQT